MSGAIFRRAPRPRVPDGKGVLRLSTRAEQDDVVIDVGDTGPGMPPDVASRAFEAFFTTKEAGKGTGLGLDIARRIITERHGGTITIDARPGNTPGPDSRPPAETSNIRLPCPALQQSGPQLDSHQARPNVYASPLQAKNARFCRRQRGLKRRLLPGPASDPEVVPSGIDDPEIRQAPGAILETLLKRPPCRYHQIAFTGDIVNFEHELSTRGWQPRREAVRDGPPRCPHPYRATLHRYVRVRVMALILYHSKAQYPSVKVDGRIKVGRKDLTPQCHLHPRIVAQPALPLLPLRARASPVAPALLRFRDYPPPGEHIGHGSDRVCGNLCACKAW